MGAAVHDYIQLRHPESPGRRLIVKTVKTDLCTMQSICLLSLFCFFSSLLVFIFTLMLFLCFFYNQRHNISVLLFLSSHDLAFFFVFILRSTRLSIFPSFSPAAIAFKRYKFPVITKTRRHAFIPHKHAVFSNNFCVFLLLFSPCFPWHFAQFCALSHNISSRIRTIASSLNTVWLTNQITSHSVNNPPINLRSVS